MFLGGDFLTFGLQLFQGADDAETGVPRLDHVFDIALLGSLVRVGEEFFVLFLLLVEDGLGVLRVCLDFFGVEDVHGTVGPHHGNLRRRPGIVDIFP